MRRNFIVFSAMIGAAVLSFMINSQIVGRQGVWLFGIMKEAILHAARAIRRGDVHPARRRYVAVRFTGGTQSWVDSPSREQ